MDEHQVAGPPSQADSRSSWLCRDGPWLVALLLIVALLRGWLLYNTEVTARDSIGFIRYSLLFDKLSWKEALCSQHQHPGYPAVVWLASTPVRAVFGTTPEVMRVTAQTVSLIAALLLAVMMFRLGKHLWDRHIGFFAALLFQCFPTSGHHLSDGISDGLFLLFVISALDFLICARESRSLGRFAVGGLFIGLAYLTRPEGLLVLPAAWIFLIGVQFLRRHAIAWRTTFSALAIVTVACIVAGSPYVIATGRLSIKPSVQQLLDEAISRRLDTEDGPLFASIFGATFNPASTHTEQMRRTLRALAVELAQALHYVGAIFAVWALLFCRKTLTRHAGFYLLAIYFVLHTAVLVGLGMTKSYVSDRHVMALVALACYLCAIGVTHMCMPWVWWVQAGRTPAASFLFPRSVQWAGAFWLTTAIVICSCKTVSRLHANRVGNHQAGLWLAKQASPGDCISDDHAWSHYYSGHMFTEGNEPALPAAFVPNHFHVVTRSKEDSGREKRESRENQEELLKQKHARLVYAWPTDVDAERARIVIYAMPRDYAANPWKKADGANVFQPVSREK